MEKLLNTLIIVNIIWLCFNIYYDIFYGKKIRLRAKIYRKSLHMVLNVMTDNAVYITKPDNELIKSRIDKIAGKPK